MAKVLIVEESMVFGTLLSEKIQSELGFDILWSKSFRETSDEIEKDRDSIFAAVLDLRLANNEDFDIIDFVISKDVPVIVCSSEFSDDAQDRMWSKKIVDYVLKAGKCSVDIIVNSLKRLRENSGVKILLVDDSSVVRASIGDLLRNQNFVILEAGNGVEALKVIDENPDIKLTLTDYHMPDMDGYELTKAIRKRYSKDVHAVIGISGQGSNRLSARFLKYGANDFIGKPFVVEELYCRINQNLDMIRTMEAVRYAAMFDYLTSIYNRRYLFQAGSSFIQNARRNNLSAMVAVLDIDDFKKINDTYGHLTGDRVIVEISQILKARFRESDIVARLGGEEFCILALNMNRGSVNEIFNEVRATIEKSRILTERGDYISVTVSIGICTSIKKDLEEMINIADKKMYKAKVCGKNRICTDVKTVSNVS